MNSGLPVNITYSPNSAQQVSTLLNQRPNQIAGVNPVLPKSQRTRTATALVALNPKAFSLPDVNTPYGNAGRNSVRFDPFYQLDLGLHKNFPIVKGTSFDFRAEAFNVFNKTNFAFPASNFGSSSFGVITAASTFPARVLQFAGKIIF
jgi:hypothetical protein